MFVPCCSPKHCVHSEGKGSSIEMKGERSGSESNSERNHRPLPPPSPLPQPPSKTKSLRQNKNQEGLQDRQLQEQEIVASRSTSESHYTHYSPLSQPRPESSPQHYIPHNQMRVQDLQQQLQQHHQQILLHRSQQRAVQHENRAVEQEENYCDSNSNHTSLDGSSTHGRCSSNGSGSNPFLNNNNNNNNNTSSSSNNNNNSNSNSERTTPKERFYEEKTLQTNEEDEEILVRVCEASGVSLRILKGGGGGGPSCYDHRPRNVSLSRCGIHTRPLSDELNYDDCGVMTHLSASESPQNLEDLAKEVQSLREENKRNHRELDRWKSNCRKYKASYLIVADHNRVLVRENSTQKWEVAYLQQRLQRQQERYDELERNYDILQDNYKTLSGLFNRLPPPDKRLEEKYEMLREDYEKISSERINLMDKVSQLTEQLACYLSETVSEDVLGGGGGGGTNGNGGGGRGGGGGSGSGGSGGGPGGGAVGNEPADGVIWTDNHHNSHHHHQQQQQQQHQHHHQQQQQHHQHHHNQLHQQQQQQLQQQSPQQHNQQQHNPQHSQKQQLQEKEQQQQQHQLHPPQHHHHHHRQPHHPHHHSREMLNDGLTDEKTPPSSTGHSKERYATGQKKNKPQPYAIRELGHYARLPPGSDGDDEDSYSNFPCSDVTVDGDSRTEIFRAGPGGHNKSNMTLGSKSSKPFIRHRKTKHRLPSVPAWLFQLKNNKVHPGDDDD